MHDAGIGQYPWPSQKDFGCEHSMEGKALQGPGPPPVHCTSSSLQHIKSAMAFSVTTYTTCYIVTPCSSWAFPPCSIQNPGIHSFLICFLVFFLVLLFDLLVLDFFFPLTVFLRMDVDFFFTVLFLTFRTRPPLSVPLSTSTPSATTSQCTCS